MSDVVVDVMKFTVPTISTLKKEVKSPPHIIAGFPWKMGVTSEESDRTDNVKCLSVCIFCDSESESTLWSCDAHVEFCILSHEKEARNGHIFEHKFSVRSNQKGFPSFIKWSDLILPKNGYVTNDSVTIEATITVSNVRGIQQLPNFDFNENGEHFSDMVLILDKKKLYVSKVYLSLYSPVFQSMFFSNFKERKEKEIVLSDVYEEFLELLRVIYPSRKTINQQNVEFLLKLADKYEMKSVINISEQFLMSSIDVPLIKKLVFADKYNLAKLQSVSIQGIRNVKEVKILRTMSEYAELSDTTRSALLEKVLKIA